MSSRGRSTTGDKTLLDVLVPVAEAVRAGGSDPTAIAAAAKRAADAGLEIEFSAPVTDHAASDESGVAILGGEERPFWSDHVGAGVNAIRTRTLISNADIVVVRERAGRPISAADAQIAATCRSHGALLATRVARWLGEDPEEEWSMLMIVMIFAVLGARLYHVIHLWACP